MIMMKTYTKIIKKEEIPNLVFFSQIKKVSHPDPEYLFLIEKEVVIISIELEKLEIPHNGVISLKMKNESLSTRVSKSEDHNGVECHSIILSDLILDDIDDIYIEYKNISEEREEKLNQIL
jgi:hypothetical protein